MDHIKAVSHHVLDLDFSFFYILSVSDVTWTYDINYSYHA